MPCSSSSGQGGQVQVSWAQLQVPEHAPGVPVNANDPCFGKKPECGGGCQKDCGGGCGCPACKPPANPAPTPFSGNPVRYGTGELSLTATDLESGGFGVPWGHTRSFANQLTQATDVGNGYNWQVFEWSYLVFPTDTTVVVMGNANAALWFDLVGSSYVPRFSVRQTLLFNANANTYQLIDLDGSITQYNASSGVFKSHSDPAGNQVGVVSYTANNFNFAEVQRTTTVGGNTTVESFLYTYVDATQMFPLLGSVLLRRQVNGGAWTNVTQALYTYYGNNEPYGATNDLKTVVTQTWEQSAWANTGTTYYRYYLSLPSNSSSSSSSARSSSSSARSSSSSARSSSSSARISSASSSSSSGQATAGVHLLKYVVLPSSYALLTAAVANPFAATDSEVARYADYYFAYDGNGKVIQESIEGGTQTFLFNVVASGNAQGYNSWAFKTIETRPDGSKMIVYSNHASQPMLTVLQSGGQQWCDFYRYDSGGLVLWHAAPSAVNGFNDQYVDLLHNVNGQYQYLNNNSGLIHTYTYHAPTGHVASESIQQGQFGVSILLHEYFYVACTPSSSSSSSSSSSAGLAMVPTYFLAEKIDYPVDPTAAPLSGAASSSSSSSGSLPQIITTYSYTWYPGTCQVQQIVTTLPVISSAQNGPGIAATHADYFDVYGNLTWQMDERGFLTNTSYDVPTGAVTQRIEDVDTSLVSNAPSGWVTPAGGGLHLITDFLFDAEGRTTQTLGPTHVLSINGVATSVRRATWMVYQDGTFQVWSAQGYATGTSPNFTYTLINPVSISVTDASGRQTATIQATRASTAGALQATDSFLQSSYVRWSTTQYADGFHVSGQRAYKLIPSSGTGVSGTNYDETDFGYDVMFRQNRQGTPGGTIVRTVLDVRDNASQIWVGTNDTGATDSDPTGGGAPGNNMVQVTGNVYDNGQPGGDNNVTQTTQYVDGSTTRVTTFLFDWRDRQTNVDGEIDFYRKTYYDNLDRVVRSELYNTNLSGNLVARQDTLYDDQSRVYQTIRYGVDPNTGLVGNVLTDNTWYDPSGHVLKSQPAGAQLFKKNVYDGLGRVTFQYTGSNLSDSSYANAVTVATDVILEQVETSYDNASNSIQVTTRQRYHNTMGVGSLGTPTSAQPQARVSYVANWQDGLSRVVASANYGTNGGTALVRPSTIPTASDTVLVSLVAFDNAGMVQTSTDPAGTVTCFTYDAVGREVQRILNCQQGSSSSSASSSSSSGGCPASDDTNVTVLTAYNADGNVSQVTAINGETGNQTTQYVYGTTLANSSIASSLLKVAEVYPDSVGGSDQVQFQYNRQSQVTTTTDQNGTVHGYVYDLLGRLTQDRITTLGTDVDGAIRRIATQYEVRGMATGLTSYDNATVGSGNVVNDVQLQYNSFSQLIADYQAHSGAVTIGSTPVVQYGYADGSSNTIRRTRMSYPNGRVLNVSYGVVGGMNDVLSRVDSLLDSDGVTQLAGYSYLGLANVVQVNEAQPGLTYTLVGITGGNDPVTGDVYQGLDLFGRIKDLIWASGGGSSSSSSSSGASPIVERIQYGYDRASNRLWRRELADPTASHDELYAYDGVDRLKDVQQGTLAANQSAITSKTFAQCWGLDATGNWQNFQEDDTGSGNWDLVQRRTANLVNEITGVSNSVGPTWVTPGYDAAGNVTTLPQPGSPTLEYNSTYDAWNRLVGLSIGRVMVAGYQYDGLKRRIVKKTYSAGILNETRDTYWSQSWQTLEERVGGSLAAERQFVWGVRSVDDLILRDRDSYQVGTLTERLFGLQDANWNVTALVDAAGTVQERYGYDPYGRPMVLTAAFQVQGQSMWAWETLYAGYRWDRESSLYQVRHRFYSPGLGCWLQRDPLGLAMGINLFVYAGDNPIIRVDSFGLFDPGTDTVVVVSVGGPVAIGVVSIGLLGWLGYEYYELQKAEAFGRALDAKILQVQIKREFTQLLKATCKDPLQNLTKKAFKELQKSLIKGGECDFFLAWCLWGAIELWKTNPHWGRSEEACWECYKTCKATGVWPFDECYIGRGPMWSTDKRKVVWPITP